MPNVSLTLSSERSTFGAIPGDVVFDPYTGIGKHWLHGDQDWAKVQDQSLNLHILLKQ